MIDRNRQIAVALVALAVLAMLWLVGNETSPLAGDGDAPATDASQPQAVFSHRNLPKDGTLPPVSIDPARPADRLAEYPADEILRDYQKDADLAALKYRDDYFIVEGVASGIRREGEDQVYLEIRTNEPALPLRANLQPRQICGPAGRVCEVEARATMVRRGQKVAVECSGGQLAEGKPLLEDCLIRGGAN
ncbi:OB-fold putative lipoprotein [Cupriavidus sp. AU9028]|uniref:OB-fold putative lipoprotein n=1 Tax=Cupriavidus sp. AU9028 TaxID=2871157 RepID=UPI001C94A963|nr:OB-fold putative lipoprotein [Cupriavidus sp. AU9028]MBY4897157.1 OB-fold putative lipoprotein [Cupriavidus sp. AU9028]